MKKPELSKIFLRRSASDPRFQATHALIESIVRGPYWVCGGYVYRTLAKSLHGYGGKIPDIDIMTTNFKN